MSVRRELEKLIDQAKVDGQADAQTLLEAHLRLFNSSLEAGYFYDATLSTNSRESNDVYYQISPDYFNRPLGEVIRRWRKFQGLRLMDICQKSGNSLTNSYLSMIETGKIKSPHDKAIFQIANSLGIDPLILAAKLFPEEVNPPLDT